MSIKSSLLFSLSLLNEIMSQLRDPLGFASFSYENMYGFVPSSYKKDNLYSLTHKLKREGFLKKEGKSFILSQAGREETFSEFPLLEFVGKPWDGKWRIFGFDIEERQRYIRDMLRNTLYKFGFRMIQKSLYISPLPTEEKIREFISLHPGLFKNIYMFTCDKFFFEHEKDFVDKVFHLTDLNNRYRALLDDQKRGVKQEERDKVVREFLEITSNDYFLPKELLPDGFLRDGISLVIKENFQKG